MEQKALEYAIIKHGEQKRRESDIPYVIHPIRVAALIRKIYPSTYVESAALLHDVLEDTNATKEEILQEFGPHVFSLVEAVTSDKQQIKKVGKAKYLREKIDKMSLEAKVLKACDRLDNISDLHPASEKHQWSIDYAEQTYFIFQGAVGEGKNFAPLESVLQMIAKVLVEKGYPNQWQ
jgi:GTP diphosphokinase / guanosine-3',5'-bis(diphosphate) 3'-diphosphatase